MKKYSDNIDILELSKDTLKELKELELKIHTINDLNKLVGKTRKNISDEGISEIFSKIRSKIDIVKYPILMLWLDTRTHNTLLRNGIDTFEDLIFNSVENLQKRRGLSPNSVKNIREKLYDNYGYVIPIVNSLENQDEDKHKILIKSTPPHMNSMSFPYESPIGIIFDSKDHLKEWLIKVGDIIQQVKDLEEPLS